MTIKKALGWFLPIFLLVMPTLGWAADAASIIGAAGSGSASGTGGMLGIPAVVYKTTDTGGEYTVTIQILAIMTLLSVLPSLLIMMTSFTRIIVVMAILRQAMGLQQTPSNQVLLGLSLFLTLFIMMPVFRVINVEAVQPYIAEEITPQVALERAIVPVHEFMLAQTRETDLQLFMRISGRQDIATPEETPIHILIPAFITSELKTAFQIGFLIFIPFLIIDLVVASILMAMGMMMLSPIIISLPFKIMLFVLIDGWALIMGTLANSFGTV
ncbi:flagellar type III secretion system pore protein FliP [Thalassolituus sp.]|uniref:flagellar type III secretion system pore protein FliP n=1 Tax=Thalassolituus TaxID=187492 RepID=UPI003982C3D6